MRRPCTVEVRSGREVFGTRRFARQDVRVAFDDTAIPLRSGFWQTIDLRPGVHLLTVQARLDAETAVLGRILTLSFPPRRWAYGRATLDYAHWRRLRSDWIERDAFALADHAAGLARRRRLAVVLEDDAPFPESLKQQILPPAAVTNWSRRADLAAEADFLVFLDAGDELAPDALYRFACALEQRPEIDMLYGDDEPAVAAQEQLVRIKPDWSPTTLTRGDYIGSGVCIRAEHVQAIEAQGRYDLTLRLLRQGPGVEHIPVPLIRLARAPSDWSTQSKALAAYFQGASEAVCDVVALDTPNPCFRVTVSAPAVRRSIGVVLVGADAGTKSLLSGQPVGDDLVITPLAAGGPGTAPPDQTAVNRAVQGLATELIFFLSSTSEFSFDGLAALTETLHRGGLCAVGAGLSLGGGRRRIGSAIVRGRSEPIWLPRRRQALTGSPFHGVHNVSATPLEGLLIRKDAFEDAGGLQAAESADDAAADLCLRLARKGGLVAVDPHVWVAAVSAWPWAAQDLDVGSELGRRVADGFYNGELLSCFPCDARFEARPREL